MLSTAPLGRAPHSSDGGCSPCPGRPCGRTHTSTGMILHLCVLSRQTVRKVRRALAPRAQHTLLSRPLVSARPSLPRPPLPSPRPSSPSPPPPQFLTLGGANVAMLLFGVAGHLAPFGKYNGAPPSSHTTHLRCGFPQRQSPHKNPHPPPPPPRRAQTPSGSPPAPSSPGSSSSSSASRRASSPRSRRSPGAAPSAARGSS